MPRLICDVCKRPTAFLVRWPDRKGLCNYCDLERYWEVYGYPEYRWPNPDDIPPTDPIERAAIRQNK